MITTVRNYLDEKVIWKRTADPILPFEAENNGERMVIRINDFPHDNLYTLIVNDEEIASFDDWPQSWVTK